MEEKTFNTEKVNLNYVEKGVSDISSDDVTAMIAGQIEQLISMDKEPVEMFQQFAKKMIEQKVK